MAAQGYPEAALVSNRASLLLYGGSEADRRAWAEEAASNFEHEGPLKIAGDDAGLAAALCFLSHGLSGLHARWSIVQEAFVNS